MVISAAERQICPLLVGLLRCIACFHSRLTTETSLKLNKEEKNENAAN